MKKNKLYYNIIFSAFTIILMLIPNNIKALSAQVNLNCDKYIIKTGDEISCDINVSTNSGKLSAFEGKIVLSDNLELISTYSSNIWEGYGDNGKYALYTDTMKDGENISIGSFKVRVKNSANNGQEIISIENILLGNENFENVTYDNLSKNLKIASTNSNLQSLSLSNMTLSPNFSENTTEYKVSTNLSTVEINATAVSGASIQGTGNKTLKYGDNIFIITVTAEAGNTKDYKIIINRIDNRSDDSTLKNLKIDNASISFKASQTIYRDIILPSNIATFKVTAEANHEKAKISYSQQQIELDYGSSATIYITVTAENGTSTKYELTATRNDDRSKNNNLKSLSINNDKITLSKNTNYKYIVEHNITNLTIKTETEDKKAKVEIIGGNNLRVGSNQVKILVTAENNDIKTYVITVLRKNSNGELTDLSNNNNLKSLKIKEIEFDFDKMLLQYNLEVEYTVTNLNIEYKLEDSKAKVEIDKTDELIIGNNIIRILVTAENGDTKTYILNIIRKEKSFEVENNEEKIIAALKNEKDYEQVKVIVYQDDELKIPNKIIKEIISSKKKITYIVKNKENDEVLYSFIIDGNLFDNYSSDIYYGLKLNNDYQKEINKILNNKDSMNITFAQTQPYPTGTTLQLKISDELKNRKSLILYTYDINNNKLLPVEEKINIENGFITVKVQEIEQYVITFLEDKNDSILHNQNNTLYFIYGILGIVILIVLIIILIIIIIKKKKNNKNFNKEKKPKELLENEETKDNKEIFVKQNINLESIELPMKISEAEKILEITVINTKEYLEKNKLTELHYSGNYEGVVIEQINPTSPLASQGIKEGDILLYINEQKIVDKENFVEIISNISQDNNITIEYNPGVENKKVNIKLK